MRKEHAADRLRRSRPATASARHEQRVVHADELLRWRFVERDLAELRLGRNARECRRDGSRLIAARRGADGVDDLAVAQKQEEELLRQPDRDVARNSRRTVALGIAQEIAKVNVRELGSPEENTPVRVPQLCGVCGHRVG